MKIIVADAKNQTVELVSRPNFSEESLVEEFGTGFIGYYTMKEGTRAYFKPQLFERTLCRGRIKGQEFYDKAIIVGLRGRSIASIKLSLAKAKKLITFDHISSAFDIMLIENGISLDGIIESDKNISDATYADLFHKLNDAKQSDKESIFSTIESRLSEGESLDTLLVSLYENGVFDNKYIHGIRENILPIRDSLGG